MKQHHPAFKLLFIYTHNFALALFSASLGYLTIPHHGSRPLYRKPDEEYRACIFHAARASRQCYYEQEDDRWFKRSSPVSPSSSRYQSRRAWPWCRWVQNAHNSPLLRLPAELRLVIYEHVLAANTPFITYTPDMFEKSDSSEFAKAASITILGGVCRQIYMEIANIPNGTSIWTSDGLRTIIHARDPWQWFPSTV